MEILDNISHDCGVIEGFLRNSTGHPPGIAAPLREPHPVLGGATIGQEVQPDVVHRAIGPTRPASAGDAYQMARAFYLGK